VDRNDTQLLARFLRTFHGGGQAEAASDAGLSLSTVWRAEKGEGSPSDETLRRLAAASGFTWPDVEDLVLPALRAIRALSSRSPAGPSETLSRESEDLAQEILEALRSALAELKAGRRAGTRPAQS
jgi:transcriptional regulator with XRE-family HTH domain